MTPAISRNFLSHGVKAPFKSCPRRSQKGMSTSSGLLRSSPWTAVRRVFEQQKDCHLQSYKFKMRNEKGRATCRHRFLPLTCTRFRREAAKGERNSSHDVRELTCHEDEKASLWKHGQVAKVHNMRVQSNRTAIPHFCNTNR
jgi:hypothetical protein